MTLLEAILLGIVQGATEFLPVSSSGHTLLVPSLLQMPEPGLTLIAIAHQGTLLAILAYFWQDLWKIAQSVVTGLARRRPLAEADSRLGWYIVLGSIPAALVGLTLEDFFEEIFGEPMIAAMFLLVTAALLVIGERLLSSRKTVEQISWIDALIIGLFQMLALFPGISRSGSTITGGLWRGLDRAAAARYSFLLSVPAVLGAGLLSVLDIVEAGDLAARLPAYLGAFVAAAITGYLCITFLLSWLRRHTLYIFAVYCALFGLLYLALALTGVV